MDTHNTTILSLGTDIILAIICIDSNMVGYLYLQALFATCKWINRVMVLHRREIINFYSTVKLINGETHYYLCKRLHRANDLPALIYGDGSREWYLCGKLHRENDNPAIISIDDMSQADSIEPCMSIWCKHGEYHRDNGPAIIYSDGSREWYWRGMRHRNEYDMPAIICADGTQRWYRYGKRHRDNDLPAVQLSNGTLEWYQQGALHRDNDKPAVIRDSGIMMWYQHGQLHRDDNKPAVIYPRDAITYPGGIYWVYDAGLTRVKIASTAVFEYVHQWWVRGSLIREETI